MTAVTTATTKRLKCIHFCSDMKSFTCLLNTGIRTAEASEQETQRLNSALTPLPSRHWPQRTPDLGGREEGGEEWSHSAPSCSVTERTLGYKYFD